jgi:hypothetical protein
MVRELNEGGEFVSRGPSSKRESTRQRIFLNEGKAAPT